MKKIGSILFFSISIAFGQKSERSQIVIPPKQVVQINYPFLNGYDVQVENQSKFEVSVSSRDRKTDSIYKEFRLKKKGSQRFSVGTGEFLQFENRFLTPILVSYSLLIGIPGKKSITRSLTPQRAFYLENNTEQFIPLHIPGVGDSKIKPFTRSGLNLANGQSIYLNLKNQKVLILTVTDTIPHGARFDLASLINKAINQR